MHLITKALYWLTLMSCSLLAAAQADTWPAIDALGRRLPMAAQHGVIRKDRYVGVFYFVWHGAHGYDHETPAREDEGVQDKHPGDTVSPYDITQMLAAHPTDPQYGPSHAYHHWGQPAFGYYVSDDEWVIRRHVQMLSDAGVDVLILDATNALIYLPQVTRLLATYAALRREGRSTPAVAFIVNTQPKETVRRLYEAIYAKGLYKELWFYWKGKPLMLCPPEGLSDTTAAFFTCRHSWAWSKGQEWFADGKDKWPWLDHTPQNYGWHEKGRPEEISVAVAEHPISNIGRSFHDGKEPDKLRSGEGLYFAEQWKRAIAVDPEFVFVTGWNEWIAMRFIAKNPNKMLGKVVPPGGSYFVDEYNEEYSRDIEPEKGPLKDNYYYQLVEGIRRYKGSRPVPVAMRDHAIQIDGLFADWNGVGPEFTDDAGDTFHRNHAGYGRIRSYTNTSGRNDIVYAKVAADRRLVSFYVRTAGTLSPSTDSNWMMLYIGTQDTVHAAWEGFQFRARKTVAGEVALEQYTAAGTWKQAGIVKMEVKGNELELGIPKKLLGITGAHFSLDFKWTDNIPDDGDPMHWLDTGDTAPNGRFRYRFIR
ncbi:hypothetical protein Q4E93_13955 [Flavitalea sp. BT771]|uniref:hypothetical protein n=1 Tax=Flavitalea sp. BT771 TaxID=3063329 RepID=UPI0026E45C64|nr:hypothetical protein [Flavitalea sp. BT771]MDO6431703.1 hypothetical protein [Flavitalea sp. BT771]MDV6220611.1 hypothetical protein [Flavitalea sp. BT771]